jgi:DNA-binding transcriptional regulator YiaG
MTHKSSRLADDIRASLREAHTHASGKTTKAIVHRVTPKETEAREARLMLGLSQDEFAALIGNGSWDCTEVGAWYAPPFRRSPHAYQRHQE